MPDTMYVKKSDGTYGDVLIPSAMLRDWNAALHNEPATHPHLPESHELRLLRKDLLSEEFFEYMDAEHADDLIEIADALGDMLYIIYGTAYVYGIDLDSVFAEIHRSNMTKTIGGVQLREDGKILKGPYYSPPNIAEVM